MVSIVPIMRQLTDLIKLLEILSLPKLWVCVFGFKNMRSINILVCSISGKYI